MYTRAYIPPNINDNGNALNGLINTRKLIEVGILSGASYFISMFCLSFLPPIAQITVMAILIMMSAIICLIGIDGHPLSIGLSICYSYRKTKCKVTLRMPEPVPEYEEGKNKKLKLKKIGSKG